MLKPVRGAIALSVCVGLVPACGSPEEPLGGSDQGCPAGGIELEDGSCQPPTSSGAVATCPAAELELEDGRCQPAGVQSDGCEAGQHATGDGACVAAGLPPDRCVAGPSEEECVPLLPAEPCAFGSFALPGEEQCHEVTSCGADPWGDIPVEPDTLYVDAAHAGGDGSEQAPWSTIQAAVDAAQHDEIIAIAAGTYAEDVHIVGKALRLWGRCPSMVEVVGQGSAFAAIRITADRVELRGLRVTGPATGVGMCCGSKGVVLESLHIHGTPGGAVQVAEGLNETVLRNVLIEQVGLYGIFALGSIVNVEASVIRHVSHDSNGWFGDGIILEPIYDGTAHHGVPATLSLQDSLIEHTTESGVAAISSDAVIERSVVRDVDPIPISPESGDCIVSLPYFVPRQPSVIVRSSIVERCQGSGLALARGDFEMVGVAVRDVLPFSVSGELGRGVTVTGSADQPTRFQMRGSRVDRVLENGVGLFGVDGLLDGVLVRDVAPATSGQYGYGVSISPYDGAPGTLTVLGSRLEGCHEVGLVSFDADVNVLATAVVATSPQPGTELWGDGISVFGSGEPPQARVAGSLVTHMARAGLSVFDVTVNLGHTKFECNAIDLNTETLQGNQGALENAGGNVCGCGTDVHGCKQVSSQIGVPTPPDPKEKEGFGQ